MKEVASYIAEAEKADGTLLAISSGDDKTDELYIAIRALGNPLLEDSPHANPNFYGWQGRDVELLGELFGVMAVDLYARNRSELQPIGHMDWGILDDHANGGGNRRNAFVPRSDHEENATAKWGRSHLAFELDENFRHQGLGSLMLATSAIVLPTFGATHFYSGATLPDADKTYARFGVQRNDYFDEGKWSPLPIDRLTQQPYTSATLARHTIPLSTTRR